MENLIKRRVGERLSSLGYNPFEAARIAGLERSFINDLLVGKKQSIRGSKLPALAAALDCDQEYLLGIQPTPRAETDRKTVSEGLRISGLCEAFAWRDFDFRPTSLPDLTILPDERYPAEGQVAFLVRGDHAAGMGVADGSVLCVALAGTIDAAGRHLRDGDAVLARRTKGDLIEITARTYSETKSGVQLVMHPAAGEASSVGLGSCAEVFGLILRAIKVF